MIYLRPGSHAHNLISILSVVGEFPTTGLHLLGNERVVKALVRNLTLPQVIHNAITGNELSCKLLGISGKGSGKTIRFHRSALPILEWIHPAAPGYYMDAFYDHHFPGNAGYKDRNHRTAEVAAVCMRLGMEFRPYQLPSLQNREISVVIPSSPSFYNARQLKRVDDAELNKTAYSRLVGAIFASDNCYAVYNTRNAVMKWSGLGEFKILNTLNELCRLNAGIEKADTAILLGKSYDVALRMLTQDAKNYRTELRFDAVYHHIHFIPQTEPGIRQLRLLTLPDWKERMLSLLFDDATRSYDSGRFEYDACVDGVYVLSHLDGDIARLTRFRGARVAQTESLEVLCFPHQTAFLRSYLGDEVGIRTIELEAMEEAMGIRNPGGEP